MSPLRCIALLIVAASSSAGCTLLSPLDGFAGARSDDNGSSDPRPSGRGGEGPSGTADSGAADSDANADADSQPTGTVDPLPTEVPQPIADWAFGEGSGTFIGDLSGHNHTGTAMGGLWTADRSGAGTTAYKLVNGSDHIEIDAHSDFNRPAGAKVTMTGWARFDAAPSHAYIIDIGFGSEGYGIELKSRTTLTYWDGVNHAIETTIPDVVGTWHHYGVAVDGSRARLYLDGVRVNEGNVDTTPRVATKVYLGMDAVEPAYARAAIDNIHFYVSALSDAAILADMNR